LEFFHNFVLVPRGKYFPWWHHPSHDSRKSIWTSLSTTAGCCRQSAYTYTRFWVTVYHGML